MSVLVTGLNNIFKASQYYSFFITTCWLTNAFLDRTLYILARAELEASDWSNQNPEYKKLHAKYQGELREILKKRFDRFAVLNRWNFIDPNKCEFHIRESQCSRCKNS